MVVKSSLIEIENSVYCISERNWIPFLLIFHFHLALSIYLFYPVPLVRAGGCGVRMKEEDIVLLSNSHKTNSFRHTRSVHAEEPGGLNGRIGWWLKSGSLRITAHDLMISQKNNKQRDNYC